MEILKLVVRTFNIRILDNPRALGAPARRRSDGGDPGRWWDFESLDQTKTIRQPECRQTWAFCINTHYAWGVPAAN